MDPDTLPYSTRYLKFCACVWVCAWADGLSYRQRCSFEQGMCLWDISEEWDRWMLDTGEKAWPQHGPPRDHTRNIAAGI